MSRGREDDVTAIAVGPGIIRARRVEAEMEDVVGGGEGERGRW
jgi:hypothetical protein